jgi:Uma2 family endonuclease
MATVSTRIEYPTSDGRPMAETDLHRELMFDLIHRIQDWFSADPLTYVSGNLLIFYEPGNKRKHVAPDVFAVHGVPKRKRLYYLMWEEGKGPDAVIEVTSKTTRREDMNKKFKLYRDVLRVQEYMMYDPTGDYLKPNLQGYSLIGADYVPIQLIDGRLPSAVLGLHLEPAGQALKLFNPATGQVILSPLERSEQARERSEQARERSEQARERSEQARERSEQALQQKAAEAEELRRQLAELQRKIAPAS